MRRLAVFLFPLCCSLISVVLSAQNLPTRLLQCEASQCVPGTGGGGAGIWVFNGRQGHGEWPGSQAVAHLTIEYFGFDSLLIRRVDQGGRTPGLTAVYTGKIEGNHIDGKVTWSWPGHWKRSPSSTWYATVLQPANYSFLDPNIACEPSVYQGSGPEASARAAQALQLKNNQATLCWLRLGARKEDPDAEGMLSAMLYKGLGGPPSYAGALNWARKSAVNNNYVGEHVLFLMYANGQGVSKDPKQAEYWLAKADRDKAAALLIERRAQDRQRQLLAQAHQSLRPQQLNVNIGAALIFGALILGSMDAGSSSGSHPSSVVCPGDPNNHSGICN